MDMPVSSSNHFPSSGTGDQPGLPASQAISKTLEHLHVRFLRDEGNGTVVVPTTLHGHPTMIFMQPDDQKREVLIFARLTDVAPSRRTAVALLIADLNARFQATFAMPRLEFIAVDVHVELSFCAYPEALIGLAFIRFVGILRETCADLMSAAQIENPLAVNLQKEIDEILGAIEEPRGSDLV